MQEVVWNSLTAEKTQRLGSSFPNHFSLTSMENVMRSKKDVKVNSWGLPMRELNYTCTRRQQMLLTWFSCGETIMWRKRTAKSSSLDTSSLCFYSDVSYRLINMENLLKNINLLGVVGGQQQPLKPGVLKSINWWRSVMQTHREKQRSHVDKSDINISLTMKHNVTILFRFSVKLY